MIVTATQRARLVRTWRDGLPAPWRTVLAPATLVYRGGLALRRAAYAWGIRRTRTLSCRVAAVGNLTVGGTGKTPLVELIARTLTAQGRRVVILSRGYGREADGVGVVSDGTRILLTVREAGDEPVLLARRLRGVPVVVGRDRARAGAWAAPLFSPDVLLLDDGFQHMRLRKDLEVVCLDARAPWGHGGLLPRGSLREPVGALARADLLVLTHAGPSADLPGVLAEVRRLAPMAPVAVAGYEVETVEDVRSGVLWPLDAVRDRPVLAFAGIAAPERFSETLAAHGVACREFVAFPDHHPYDRSEILWLEARARAVGAEVLLTTEKDAVRLLAGSDGPTGEGRRRRGDTEVGGTMGVWTLRVRLRFMEADSAWWATLEARLARV